MIFGTSLSMLYHDMKRENESPLRLSHLICITKNASAVSDINCDTHQIRIRYFCLSWHCLETDRQNRLLCFPKTCSKSIVTCKLLHLGMGRIKVISLFTIALLLHFINRWNTVNICLLSVFQLRFQNDLVVW